MGVSYKPMTMIGIRGEGSSGDLYQFLRDHGYEIADEMIERIEDEGFEVLPELIGKESLCFECIDCITGDGWVIGIHDCSDLAMAYMVDAFPGVPVDLQEFVQIL